MELFNFGTSILIVAAHPDDESLGMGGTIRKLSKLGCQIRVLFLSDGISSRDIKRESLEARQKASRKALSLLGVDDIHFYDFLDNQLDATPILVLAKQIEVHIHNHKPRYVFTNFPLDLNVDHKAVAEATQVACRPKSNSSICGVFFFEVPSSTDWDFTKRRFSPNFFIDIESTLDLKLRSLAEYEKEMEKFPNARSIETMISLAKIRGSFVGMNAAEGFEIAFLRG